MGKKGKEKFVPDRPVNPGFDGWGDGLCDNVHGETEIEVDEQDFYYRADPRTGEKAFLEDQPSKRGYRVGAGGQVLGKEETCAESRELAWNTIS